MERTIKVTGRGQLKLEPDLVRLNIGLRGVCKTFSEAMTLSGQRCAEVERALSAAGFDRKEIKTAGFSINTKYENARGDNGEWKQVFAGYEFVQDLRLETSPGDGLHRAAGALEGCALSELSFVYTVQDPSAAAETLLREAAADARRKAEVLAAAEGVTLQELISADYAFSPRPIESRVMPLKAVRAEGPELRPEEIELSDSVTLVWAIA